MALQLSNKKTIRSLDEEHVDFTCIWSAVDEREKCKPKCKPGYFGLYGMRNCHPLLTCEEIEQLNTSSEIGHQGYVKEVWQSNWNSFPVVVKILRSHDIAGIIARPGYFRGINLMKNSPQRSVLLQLVGQCNDTIVTEIHPLLDARYLETRLKEYPQYNTLSTRMKLCISYVDILRVLHSGIDRRIYVQCDARSLNKLTGQYLLTEDFRLVLSDVDSMEAIKFNDSSRRLIKCTDWGQVTGYFPAPEELWPYKGSFDASKMPLYDEKIEIWKIPDVCLSFLGDDHSALKVKRSLKEIHKLCKNPNPRKRPSAAEVLHAYVRVLRDVIKSKVKISLSPIDQDTYATQSLSH
ncbi:protein O-mannose kinase-like [Saccostrea echinata]|uniref:protein O-mannose kinase-like n=1 Tax=Saccostrea echinata TaxID=191078 RepID=UPI002A836CDA|nr:protein O-mannose kinase-like [Saccostrea echinata]